MKYNQKDFTEKNYRKILRLLTRTNEKTIFYNEIENNINYALWRHDVDFSVHRALKLAKIENKKKVKATYFFQLNSMLYNLFEEEIKNKILKIKELGHDIALHFDPTQYDIKSKEDLEIFLNFEKNILENLFKTQIKVFSFHNPTEEILRYDDFKYAGMINTYSKYFKENIAYCSDSNGYWRHKRLKEFLNEKNTKIQVLTHPCWWQKEVMKPRKRIQRCIDGREKYTAKNYDQLLSRYGRENVK